MESCGPLARLLVREDAAAHILPVVQKFSVVRGTVSKRGHLPCEWAERANRRLWRSCTLAGVCAACCSDAACRLQHPQCSSVLLRAQDKSWRVRYNVAQQLYQLCEALGPELSRCAAQLPLARLAAV